jgi:hypothetical protein
MTISIRPLDSRNSERPLMFPQCGNTGQLPAGRPASQTASVCDGPPASAALITGRLHARLTANARRTVASFRTLARSGRWHGLGLPPILLALAESVAAA